MKNSDPKRSKLAETDSIAQALALLNRPFLNRSIGAETLMVVGGRCSENTGRAMDAAGAAAGWKNSLWHRIVLERDELAEPISLT